MKPNYKKNSQLIEPVKTYNLHKCNKRRKKLKQILIGRH